MKSIKNSMILLVILMLAAGCNNNLGIATDDFSAPVNTAEIEKDSLEGENPGIRLTLGADSKGRIGIISTNKDNPYFNVKEEPAGSGMYYVEINLRPDGMTHYREALFSIYKNDSASGYMVNIGDSSTVNGWSGDSGTQQNDCELQIQDNILKVFGSDKLAGAKEIHSESNAIPSDGSKNIRIKIRNNTVEYWKNFQTSATTKVYNPNLFALNGQSDNEGPEDYKIYAGFNRVVANTYRKGSGIVDVYIYLNDPEPEFAQDVWDFMYEEDDTAAAHKRLAIQAKNATCQELESVLRKGPVYDPISTSYREETLELRDADFDTGYWFLGPDNYDPQKKYPLLLVFHGGGGSTLNNPSKCRSLADSYISRWKDYANSKGVFIAAPWSSKNWGFTGTEVAVNTIQKISKSYNIDADRVYLWGQSMGGHMAWRSVLHFTDRWAGSSPVCGGYKQYTLEMFKNLINSNIYHIWANNDWYELPEAGQVASNMLRFLNIDHYSIEKNNGHDYYTEEFGNILNFFLQSSNSRDMYPEFVQANTIYGPGTLVETPKIKMTASELTNGKDGVTFTRDMPLGRNYWIDVTLLTDPNQPASVAGSCINNVINISATGAYGIEVYIHEDMVDLSKPVQIKINGQSVFYNMVRPAPQVLLDGAREFQDNGRIYYNRLSFSIPGE